MNPTRIKCTPRTEAYWANGNESSTGAGTTLRDFTGAVLLVVGSFAALVRVAGMHDVQEQTEWLMKFKDKVVPT